jgi:amino-acid N-acetyltransferase
MFEIDKNPVACVALHVCPEERKGELACLYVSAAHGKSRHRPQLVQFIETKPGNSGCQELICLSTQAFHLLSEQRRICRRLP